MNEKITNILKEIGFNAIGLYGSELAGLSSFYENERNPMIKYIKCGGVFYLIQIGKEAILTESLPHISVSRIIDDTFYNAVGLFASDSIGLSKVIDNNINVSSGKLEDVIKSAIIWTIIEEEGKMLSKSHNFGFIRHISSKLGINY